MKLFYGFFLAAMLMAAPVRSEIIRLVDLPKTSSQSVAGNTGPLHLEALGILRNFDYPHGGPYVEISSSYDAGYLSVTSSKPFYVKGFIGGAGNRDARLLEAELTELGNLDRIDDVGDFTGSDPKLIEKARDFLRHVAPLDMVVEAVKADGTSSTVAFRSGRGERFFPELYNITALRLYHVDIRQSGVPFGEIIVPYITGGEIYFEDLPVVYNGPLVFRGIAGEGSIRAAGYCSDSPCTWMRLEGIAYGVIPIPATGLLAIAGIAAFPALRFASDILRNRRWRHDRA